MNTVQQTIDLGDIGVSFFINYNDEGEVIFFSFSAGGDPCEDEEENVQEQKLEDATLRTKVYSDPDSGKVRGISCTYEKSNIPCEVEVVI